MPRVKVVITGATGFVGRSLVGRLARDGHQVVAWVRDERRARGLLSAGPEVVVDDGTDDGLRATVDGADAVINLAGEPVAGGRWTPGRRARILHSRLSVTRRVVEAIEAADRRPRALVSASAVGYYGDRHDELLSEHSPAGQGFLAQVCQQWEQAAVAAEPLGVRVVRLRIGVVLGRDGGALARMLPVFRAGLGGALGSGGQYLSWVHLHDLHEMIVQALLDERYRGPINATAPAPVTSRAFSATLAAAVGRSARLRVPATLLRLGMGEAASVLLASQRAEPGALQQLGFVFRHGELAGALEDLLAPGRPSDG